MKIRLKENLKVARKVLAAIQKLGVYDSSNMWVECYSNCREQGYCIQAMAGSGGTLSVSFSENRNSDSIVVYVGKNFAVQGNIPSEEDYKKAKFFKPGAYAEAAKYIVKQLESV